MKIKYYEDNKEYVNERELEIAEKINLKFIDIIDKESEKRSKVLYEYKQKKVEK